MIYSTDESVSYHFLQSVPVVAILRDVSQGGDITSDCFPTVASTGIEPVSSYNFRGFWLVVRLHGVCDAFERCSVQLIAKNVANQLEYGRSRIRQQDRSLLVILGDLVCRKIVL